MTTATAERVGDWITTASGRSFWPLDPRPKEVHFHDILVSLPRINRYLGHTRGVAINDASHSLCVEKICMVLGGTPEQRMACLMHDTQEVYIGDWLAPVGRFVYFDLNGTMTPLKVVKQRIQDAIDERFKLPKACDFTRHCDNLAFVLETEKHMDTDKWTIPLPDPPDVELEVFDEETSRTKFLHKYTELDLDIRGLW